MTAPCPSCGAENAATGRFCEECGAPLALACPSCGSPVTAGKRFCGTCGTALAGAAPAGTGAPAAAPASVATSPVAERRLCSILFCDLVGFTPLSESRDPEEVRELLSRYFDTARTVITRYGGVVEKFIGDAVMAVWGTPVAVEGDTERAVRAALDLVEAIAALGLEINAPGLAARAGVVSGEVAVTVGATNEGMVAGDAVNTAARVQSVATPGSVLVDAQTRRLAQAGVEFVDAGEFELKGKTEPQQLWRAGRVLSNVGGAQRVDGLEAPLTGRDPELRLIKELFHVAVDRRQARLVTVSGPAGVGKSRLGWEFEKYVDGLADGVWWHRGRCLSYGEGVSFWALAEIVRQRLDIAEEDSAEVAAEKLAEGMRRYLTDPQEQEYVGIRLARLLGLAFASDTGQNLAREELFAGWRLWFERLAESSPVVLLVEDLHNADAGLSDFLDHLLDWSRDAPIFVLAFARPDMPANLSNWGSGRNRSQLPLDPLDPSSMTTLLDTLVPGLPASAAEAINAQARGIPLYAVETIRALIDRDIVVPVGGVYQLVGDVGTLTVPDSLHALFAARLDVLAPDVRSLVADAAVLGTSFPPEAVSAVSGRDVDAVRDVLGDLVRRGVFEVVADPLSPQRGTYRFSNEMLRQVARGTLSRRDRKARHLAVAAHLRATFANDGEEVADVIAQHYLDALNAMPDADDADATRAAAVDALVRAGERAQRVGALGRAGDTFAAAADLVATANTPDTTAHAADLWVKAANCVLLDGRYTVAAELAIRAHDAFVEVGDTRGAARADSNAGRALRPAGRHAEARELVERALEVLRDTPDEDTVQALNQLSALETLSGGPDADRFSTDTIATAQRVGVQGVLLVAVFNNRAIILSGLGRPHEAALYMRETARLAEMCGDTYGQSLAYSNLADLLSKDDPAGSAEAARQGVTLARRAGSRPALSLALANVAGALVDLGDWDGAAAVLAEAVEQDGLGDEPLLVMVRTELAAMRGDVSTARELHGQLGFMLTSEDQQDQSNVANAEALIAMTEERYDVALAKSREALKVVDVVGIGEHPVRLGWRTATRAAHAVGDDAAVDELLALLDGHPAQQVPPMLQAERVLVRARRAARLGSDTARGEFDAAIVELRKRSTPYDLAQGLLDHAEFLVARGDSSAAGALVDEARDIAQRLGAVPVINRADGVLSSAHAR